MLSPDILKGVRVGVSVSESPDLGRLGLLEGHFRLALGEIARSLLVLGGGLAYGGHLDPKGYTAFLFSELKRYGRRDRPLAICLSWSEHRRVPLSILENWRRDLGLYGDLTCLDPNGISISPSQGRAEEPAPETESAVIVRSLTSLRKYMSGITQGQVLIGGKRHGFGGSMPGLLEEALVTLQANHPLYLPGGFGGVTLDIIRVLKPEDADWAPTHAQTPPGDARYTVGLAELADLTRSDQWRGLNNGLKDEENRRLAATHRPSEIAALLSLGLGRLAMEDHFRH